MTSRGTGFRPWPLLGNRHVQTLLGNRIQTAREPASATWLVPLSDGDQLAVEVSTPPGWRECGPVVVMVHGLCGSHRSVYMVRIAAKLSAAGARVARVNFRGNGSGAGLARRPYHAGCSDDLGAALEVVRAASPGSAPWLVGFSLGGNVALKLAGELGPAAGSRLAGVLAICPPVDLVASWRRMCLPAGLRYQRLFVGWLVEEMRRRHQATGEPLPELPAPLSIFEFDDRYTAPRVGFSGAMAYYTGASALPWVSRIAVPCRVLVAEDDPVIDPGWLDQVSLPRGARVLRSPAGGHLGFVGSPGVLFMDDVVLGVLEPE